jgi:hypothetical protein
MVGSLQRKRFEDTLQMFPSSLDYDRLDCH